MTKRHKILEELGYIEKYDDLRDIKGRFITPIYVVNETTDKSLWKTNNFPPEIQQIISSNLQAKKSGTESPCTVKHTLYKKEKNKRNIYINELKLMMLVRKTAWN